MRAIGTAIAMASAACGFSPGGGDSIDAPDVVSDGPPSADGDPLAIDGDPGDGAPDAPPVYVVVDTLTVPCTIDQPRTSAFVLEVGVEYRVRASGTCYVDQPTLLEADAEWWSFSPPNDYSPSTGADVGLAIDDLVVDPTKQPKWGDYAADHVYELPWPGGGAPITGLFHDGNYVTNGGALTLEILAPT